MRRPMLESFSNDTHGSIIEEINGVESTVVIYTIVQLL